MAESSLNTWTKIPFSKKKFIGCKVPKCKIAAEISVRENGGVRFVQRGPLMVGSSEPVGAALSNTGTLGLAASLCQGGTALGADHAAEGQQNREHSGASRYSCRTFWAFELCQTTHRSFNRQLTPVGTGMGKKLSLKWFHGSKWHVRRILDTRGRKADTLALCSRNVSLRGSNVSKAVSCPSSQSQQKHLEYRGLIFCRIKSNKSPWNNHDGIRKIKSGVNY